MAPKITIVKMGVKIHNDMSVRIIMRGIIVEEGIFLKFSSTMLSH
jgi:hypothetical protein